MVPLYPTIELKKGCKGEQSQCMCIITEFSLIVFCCYTKVHWGFEGDHIKKVKDVWVHYDRYAWSTLCHTELYVDVFCTVAAWM